MEKLAQWSAHPVEASARNSLSIPRHVGMEPREIPHSAALSYCAFVEIMVDLRLHPGSNVTVALVSSSSLGTLVRQYNRRIILVGS